MNGIYSDMIKNKEISKDKVKDIISSIKNVKKSSKKTDNVLSKYYGSSGNYNVYINNRSIIIYDTNLIDINDIDIYSNEAKIIFDKSIKCYIGIRWNESGFCDLFNVYAENKEFFYKGMDLMLSINVEGISNRFFLSDVNKYNVKELKWIKENKNYYIEQYKKFDTEIYDIFKIKTPIVNAKKIANEFEKRFNKEDLYDMKLTTIIANAENKCDEYFISNHKEFLTNNAIKLIKKQNKNRVGWFKENFKHSGEFIRMFKFYYGENEWNELSEKNKGEIINKVDKLFYELNK
jgi:hypothetical protein